jgi:Uma2 family endonuclease
MSHNLTLLDDDYIPPELIGVPHMTPELFEQVCRNHRKLRLELTSTGELIIMPHIGAQSSRRNANLISQLVGWNETNGSGVCFVSSTVFALPNGAWRMPDASWYKREKWDRLTKEEKEDFGRFCPDFVVELRTPADDLPSLLCKMEEYIANGASLGWLVDPDERRVYIYEPDHELLILENPETVSGEPLLPGFTLNVTRLW